MIKSRVSSPTSGVRPSESGRGRHACLDIRSTSGFLCAQPEGWAGLRRRALPHWDKAQSEVRLLRVAYALREAEPDRKEGAVWQFIFAKEERFLLPFGRKEVRHRSR